MYHYWGFVSEAKSTKIQVVYEEIAKIDLLLALLDRCKQLYNENIINYNEYSNTKKKIEKEIKSTFYAILKVLNIEVGE